MPAEDFTNGTNVWYNAIAWIDGLYVKYDIPHGSKDLFYSLIQTGTAKSTMEERVLIVEKVLKLEGLSPIVKKGSGD